jgi:hypothetical protein
LHVRISPDIPANAAARTIWSASNAVGANTAGLSSPNPHSLSVNVFTVKCRKP